MKNTCLGYIDHRKLPTMTEEQQQARTDECRAYDDHRRGERALCSRRRPSTFGNHARPYRAGRAGPELCHSAHVATSGGEE
jgi:hypothetical protein